MAPWRAGDGHLALQIRLTPKAAVDHIDGRTLLSDGREVLALRVRAAPEAGAANDALIRLLAAALGVPRSAVIVARDHQARQKQLRIEGDPDALLDRAERLWPTSPEGRS